MKLKRTIFLLVTGLLAVVIVATGVATCVFIVKSHRIATESVFRTQLVFLAGQAEPLVFWDDRVALKSLLHAFVHQGSDVAAYAFIEREGQPYVHTFDVGVPKALLLGLPAGPHDQPVTREGVDAQGRRLRDMALPVADGQAIVHFGVLPTAIDRHALARVLTIAAFSVLGLVVGTVLAAVVTRLITREVDRMTGALAAEISVRKQAEHEVRQSEERHRAITETANDAIIVANADGSIRFWNPAAERIFGFAAPDVLGKNMLDLIVPPQFHEAKRRGMAEFARTGQGPVLGKTLELTALRKDGTEFPIELSLSSYRDGEKHVAVTTIRDISERQKAERSLAETLYHQIELNEMQRNLLAPGHLAEKLTRITAIAVGLFDVDFCRIWITKPGDRCESGCIHAKATEGPHVCKLRDRCLHLMASSGRYTHTDGEVHRRVPFGCYKIGRVASGEDHKFLTNEAASDPRVHHHEWVKELGLVSFAGYQLRPPGGETIGVLALFSKHVITPETDAMLESLANTATHVIQSAEAEEEQRSLQGQLAHAQKLESIGQLAAGIAHEINTPTQFVGDNIRFLQDAFADLKTLLAKYTQLHGASRSGSPPPELVAEVDSAVAEADMEYLEEEVPKAIAQSLEGVERVARIVRSMKEFSHPGGENMQAVNLNKAIESTITVARNEWKYVADMVTDFDPSLPLVPCLVGDFNQVILNMIINAGHAIKDVVGDNTGKKGTITVTTRQSGDRAEIRISDTGTGIREEIRSRIFDPFFTTKEVGKGTGQGLAIAHNVVVKKHGGTIDVESTVGRGTTFIIHLPLAPASNDQLETEHHE